MSLKSAVKKVLNDEELDLYDIISLLELPETSEEVRLIGKKAGELARELTDRKGKVWAAIGLDYVNCRMNCSFCSLGDKWNAIGEQTELSDSRVMEIVKAYAEKNADWIVLRTTEFYPLDKLLQLVTRIKKEVKGDYILPVNTGNDNTSETDKLLAAGVEMVYHAIRLREGEDTNFNPAERKEVVKHIKASGLKLSEYLEPIGPEHTNEEIARRMLALIEEGTDVAGIMPRVPVAGTPKYESGILSEKRIAQITAIFRIDSRHSIKDIVIHPRNDLAIGYGANVLVVDTGAIPRSNDIAKEEWDELGIDKAREILRKYGYDGIK